MDPTTSLSLRNQRHTPHPLASNDQNVQKNYDKLINYTCEESKRFLVYLSCMQLLKK